MRGLKQGIVGLALAGGAAVPGTALAVAQFDVSGQIVVGVGNSLGMYTGAFGSLPLSGDRIGDGSLDAGDLFNNTGTAAEISADSMGGPTLSGAGGISTTFTPGMMGTTLQTPASTAVYDPAAVIGQFLSWNETEGSKRIATGQKVTMSGSASGGGALAVGNNSGAAGVGETSKVSMSIVNASSTEALILDFVAIPNLFASVSTDGSGETASVRAAINLGFFGFETSDVEYIMQRGCPADAPAGDVCADNYGVADKQQFPDFGFDAVSFAQNVRSVDGGPQTSFLGAGQQPVPSFAWVQATIAPGGTGTFVIEFVALAELETTASSEVPVPAALPLLGGALAGLGLMARRRRAA